MRHEPAQSSCPSRAHRRKARRSQLALLSLDAVSRVSATCPQVAASTALTAVLPVPPAEVRIAQTPVRVGQVARVAQVRRVAPTSVPVAWVHRADVAASAHETAWAAPAREGIPWMVDQFPVRGPCPGVSCLSWPSSWPSCPACQAPGPAAQRGILHTPARPVAVGRAETDLAADLVTLGHGAAGRTPVAAGVARHPADLAAGTACRQQASHR